MFSDKLRSNTNVFPSEIPSLNGWRALAIIFVLFSHLPLTLGKEAIPEYLLDFRIGAFGVRIFFVLSGFLITHLLIKEYEKNNRILLGKFFTRRALRLLPVSYLYLIVLFILQLLNIYKEDISSWIGVLTYSRNIIGKGNSLTVHFWSLSIEEQFYLFLPFIVKKLVSKKRFILLIVLALFIVIANASRAYVCEDNSFLCLRIFGNRSILKYIDSLAIGAIGAVLLPYMHDKLKRFAFLDVFLLIVAVILQYYPFPITWANATIQACLILVAIIMSTHKNAILFNAYNLNWVNYVGKISYSLYLWHVLFLFEHYGLDINNVPSFALIMFDWKYWWIFSFITAIGSYELIEKRINKLKSKFKT